MTRIQITIDPDLADLIPGYLANRQADVKKLREALASGDLDDVRRSGHNMKGTGAAYGFDEISSIGAKMEVAGKEGDEPTAVLMVQQLADYLDRIELIEESA